VSAPFDAEWCRATHASIDPAVLVALMAVCQIAAWTLAPALTHSSLPLDVVEGYMWGREWVVATYKHPALPSWVLEITRIVTGTVGWPAYLVSQLFIAATFLFAICSAAICSGPGEQPPAHCCLRALPSMRGRPSNSIITLLKCRFGLLCLGRYGARRSARASPGGRLSECWQPAAFTRSSRAFSC
jgi:hypothetical protein